MSSVSVGFKQQTVDVRRLFELWNNSALTVAEISRELRCTTRKVYAMADKYGLPRRKRNARAFVFDDPTPEEEAASADSLALSPEVAARIEQLRIGFPARSS